MSKYIILTVILLLSFVNVNAQREFYKTYDWGNPISIPVNETKEKVIIKKKEVIEFTYEGDNFIQLYTKDQIEFINSDDEVENSNKRYIPYSQTSKVVKARARVIKPNNEVLLLDDSKILTSVNEETGEHYRYFAFEGLEKGSIIQYLYTIKSSPKYTGVHKTIQGETPIYHYEFDLISDTHLFFKFKLYNDTNTIALDTLIEEKNHWKLYLDSVPELKDEELAPYSLLVKHFNYKLDSNTATNSKDISSYGSASRNIYANIYDDVDKADKKAIKKLIKKIDVSKDDRLEDKIRKVENYIKENITVTESSDDVYSKPEMIYSNMIADEFGITKLFGQIFNSLGIKHQLVITCSRNFAKFDEEYESFNFLREYVIYITETKKFLAPYETQYRYGFIPANLTDNYGLFIKGVKLGEFSTGIGRIKYIPPIDCSLSYSNLNISVKIDDNMDKVNVDITDIYGGYYAAYIQPYFHMLNGEQKEDLAKEQLYLLIKNIDIKDWKIENIEKKDIGVKDLIISCHSEYDELIENAGKKSIIKVGELIGSQSELYNKEERRLPVYSDFLRTYNRKVEIVIPDGYTVKNLDDLVIFADYKKDGETVLLFDSKYTINGNTINIIIKEYYNQIYFTVDEYPEYQKVVNSASDFNKVALIVVKD